jgi:hypothetical protein
MAVGIEFANVILRKSAMEQHVAGGVDAIAQLSLPNFAEDEHLVRIGFMSTVEAIALMQQIEDFAAPPVAPGEAVTIVQWGDLPYPAWLTVGVVDDETACWLAGTPPGPVVRSEGTRALLCFGVAEGNLLELLRSVAEVPHAEAGANGDVCLTCVRNDALVEVRLLEAGDRAIVLVDRKFSRRRQRADDLGLADDLIGALLDRGGGVLA